MIHYLLFPQLTPSKPSKQLHWYMFTWFKQSPPFSHGLDWHSLISEINKKESLLKLHNLLHCTTHVPATVLSTRSISYYNRTLKFNPGLRGKPNQTLTLNLTWDPLTQSQRLPRNQLQYPAVVPSEIMLRLFYMSMSRSQHLKMWPIRPSSLADFSKVFTIVFPIIWRDKARSFCVENDPSLNLTLITVFLQSLF